MNEKLGGRLLASIVITSVTAAVVYQACDRASTIYFFEMNTHYTVFIEKWQATLFPFLLSFFIYLVYWSTKRTLIVEEKIMQQKLKHAKSISRLGSRRVSMSYSYNPTGDNTRRTSFSNAYQDDNMAEQAGRLKRLLTAIEEQDTVQKDGEKKLVIPENDMANKTPPPPPRFTVDRVQDLRGFSDPTGGAARGRLGSMGKRISISENPDDLVDDVIGDEPEACDPYLRLLELDPPKYLWSLVSFTPSSYADEGIRPMDILSEVVAVHLPIWGCVVALYVVLLELMDIKLPYFFYYHGSLFAYGALLGAIACGIVHELRSNWLTNNILALASVYVIISRVQVIGYQAGVIFVLGVVAADMFWFFAVDLITTCVQNKRAPIFIMLPYDWNGNKEVVTTSTFIVPAVFAGLVLKYSSMYDTLLYANTFYAFTSSIALQLLLDIFRDIKLPGLVLPSLTAVIASVVFSSHRQDLWRFLIKH